jgi:hypothetical protein
MSRRTPTTFELMARIFEILQPGEHEALQDGQVVTKLQALAQSDETLRQQYLAFLDNQASYLYDLKNSSALQGILSTVRELRPDPDRGNDHIRILLTHIYLSREMKAAAQHMVAEIQTGVSFFQRVRFFAGGLYAIPRWGGALVALLVAFGLLLLLPKLLRKKGISWTTLITRLVPKVPSKSRKRGSSSSTSSEQGEERLFVQQQSKSLPALNPRLAEYTRILTLFGLRPTATLKEIKAAYRSAVKSAHPDAQSSGSGVVSEGFIRLTASYDRLLELRRELALPEE